MGTLCSIATSAAICAAIRAASVIAVTGLAAASGVEDCSDEDGGGSSHLLFRFRLTVGLLPEPCMSPDNDLRRHTSE